MTIEEILKHATDLQNDSREVRPGDVFLAYPGEKTDGRRFIANAIERGALAVFYEPENFAPAYSDTVPLIEYPSLAKKLGYLASQFYPTVHQAFKISGVTGTNGKTSVAYQLAQAHELLGKKSTYMGTLGAGSLHKISPLRNTTPDALCVQKTLHAWGKEGIQHVAMEVSSHGLCEGRVSEVLFTQAIYTNLSHEHLDYHKTLEAYAAAKSMLFAYPSLHAVILNRDDAYAAFMGSKVPQHTAILTYGIEKPADVYAQNISSAMTGSLFQVKTPLGIFECSTRTLGRFNIYNSLAVIASLIADGYALSDIADVLPKLVASPGRMQQISLSPSVLVDYAHTPDALEKVLGTLSLLKKGKLIVVFGCGGDRDKEKRPLMARIAEKYADQVIITSDNPRTEDAYQILKEIAVGFSSKANVEQIENRKEAIEAALTYAGMDDIVLIAGKGHETYQEIRQQRFPFSDEAVVKAFISRP